MKQFSKVFVLLAFAVLAIGCGHGHDKDNDSHKGSNDSHVEQTTVTEPDAPAVVAENNADAAVEGDNEAEPIIEPDFSDPVVSDEPLDNSFDPADSAAVEIEGGAEAGVPANEEDVIDPAASEVVEIENPAPAPAPQDNNEVIEPAA